MYLTLKLEEEYKRKPYIIERKFYTSIAEPAYSEHLLLTYLQQMKDEIRKAIHEEEDKETFFEL